MKNNNFSLLLFGMITLFTGCGKDNQSGTTILTEYEAQDGETVLYESERSVSISVEKIPFDNIKYNDESFSLKSIGMYFGETESGHGYIPYVTAEFDLSLLSEDSFYWILKDWGQDSHLGSLTEITQTFGVTADINSEQNNIDSESLEKLKAWADGETIYYVFCLTNEYKNDFSDMELTLRVNVKQDETYEYENDEGEIISGNKTYDYAWSSINWEYGDLKIPVLSIHDMPEEILQKFSESEVDSENESNSENGLDEGTKNKISTGQSNALESALSYLDFMAFSYTGLIEQLEYEGYSTEDATYAADNCGADWNEQAVKCVKSYLDSMPFSKEELISQLEYEGFTHEQAVYGVEQNGY